MAYEPPATNITSSLDFFSWINTSVNNWFFIGIVTAIYFVMLIRMMYNPQTNTAQAFTASSFICMILTVLLRVADLCNTSFMVIFIILTAVGAVWMHNENAKFG